MNPAPILLFVYNRPLHTRRTVEALQMNDLASQSELYVYSDGPKTPGAQEKVDEVRRYLRTIRGFQNVTIVERDRNWGLAPSVIDGVTYMTHTFDRVIVVEDDLITNPHFLKFMNEGLEKYADDERVASIHGFTYAIDGLPHSYFLRGADCWGWATWKRAWNIFEPDGKKLLSEIEDRNLSWNFNFNGTYPYVPMLKDQIEGKNSSWAIRWLASAYLKNMLTLYPGASLVKNIGFDTGTHIQHEEDNYAFGTLSDHDGSVGNPRVEHDEESFLKIVELFKSKRPSFFGRVVRRMRKELRKIFG